MMKRFAAALLSACLALGPCTGSAVPVYGASEKAAQTQTQESALEIRAVSTQMFPYEGEVTVEVSGKSGFHEERKIAGDASAPARFSAPAGDYTVRILAKKFAAYTQEIHAEAGWTHKIQVCAAQTVNEGKAAPGWIRPGDVDGDGDIDKEDSEALLAAIRTNQADAACDLNGDGRADLADLHFLVQSMDEKQESAVEKLWIPTNVIPESGTALEAGSDLEDLFRDEGSVKLRGKADGPVSEENPVALMITLAEDGKEAPKLGGMTIKAPDSEADGETACQITDGTVEIVSADENGTEQTVSLPLHTQTSPALAAFSLKRSGASVASESDGSIVIDFGGQIAVKRVSIRITGTKKTQPLVEIAKVTFVNNMEDRIPDPQLDIPSITSVKPGSQKLTVSWNAQKNTTGYELYVSGPVKKQSQPQSQIIAAAGTSYEIASINQNDLVNFEEYTVKVRSVNGDWRSPWSEAKTAKPQPLAKPAPPDNVKAEGGYRSVTVSWKAMDDADGYMVYYKESDASDYQPAVKDFTQTDDGTGRLLTNSYTITGLKEQASYSVYVVSWNAFGWSSQSLASQAQTRSGAAPALPAYKLLNTSNGVGQLTAHIVDAVIGGGGNAGMMNSPLDTEEKSGLGLVDDDYASYWSKVDWDDGVAYVDTNQTKGMTVTLDADYRMNYFTFAAADQKAGFETVRVEYWSQADAQNAKTAGARLLEKYDVNQNPYYIVKLDETITANKIKLCLGRATLRDEMKVGEIRFYEYDPLEDEIMAMYADEMHTTLRNDVNAETIQEYKNRLETIDAASGEKHPLYDELALELQTAEEILTAGLDPSVEVYSQITAQKDKHLGFGGLNAWQPLGKTALAGETLLVYVGHHTKRTGDAAQLSLVFTQQHAESSGVARTVSLKVGRNIVTVPQLSDKETERGGQIYAAYTGNSDSDKYAVRISGGSGIPVLNVYGKSETERTEAIRAYIEQLEAHVASLQTAHGSVHAEKQNAVSAYDEKNCILNATDIQMQYMLYSLPASQVLAGIGSGQSMDAKVSQLDNALAAMDQMMALFYQHKGLSDAAGTERGNNALPSQHLNIRYMRMFAGAFMYASGNHIGIEWDSTPVAGSAKDRSSFGWGIAHEIGHNINQGSYAVAEITNNYFAQLMKKIADGDTRFDYQNVYQKVTSGALGRSSNVFTQLAMYWQLYLAYSNEKDDGYLYEDYETQFNNLFFARVDTYARNPEKAPNGGVTLGDSTDQNLMRLACAAAQKDLLEFFRRWGMEPDETTAAYADGFEKETKAIYYINDEVRDYRIDYKNNEEESAVRDQDIVQASVNADASQVTVTISAQTAQDQIFGYEIIRSMVSNGEKKEEVAGFQLSNGLADTIFKDYVCNVDNRVVSYEVRAVDKYLNYSNAASAGSVKIQTDGELDKSAWTVTTNMVSDDDEDIVSSEEDPDSGYDESNPSNVTQAKVNSIERVIDNDKTTAQGTYQEAAGSPLENAQITIDLHQIQEVTALKYQGSPVSSLTVEVSQDGQSWTAVKTDDTGLADADVQKEEIIWFDAVNEAERGQWIGTYDARYLRLTMARTSLMSVREIAICGPSGDHLEFLADDGGIQAVGKLADDYRYGSGEQDVIPKDSLIFTGTYKGNPAYNVIVLYDTQGNVIGAKDGTVHAEQVIFAPVPDNGNLGETSEGTWVYYVEPGQWDESALETIAGVRGELYRVDDAKTSEGERVVSDTQIIRLPETLPDITLQGASLPGM